MDNVENTVQIIPFYSQPHVHTVINDNTAYEETKADVTSTSDLPYSTVVVTGADKGIDNTFVKLTNLATKEAVFGKSNFTKYGQPSIQADVLFNGSTNVWFCRVLPDNALYANLIVLAHYRKGKILDELGQETGLSRLEIKFSTAYASKPSMPDGAKTENDIELYAQDLVSAKADPLTGYMTIPICYVRSTGRGKYGNNYSLSISRDADAEKEYGLKMYNFTVLDSSKNGVPKAFSGSLTDASRYDMSVVINDVIDQYATGSTPVMIKPFEGSIETLFNFYKDDIVASNYEYIQASGATLEELDVVANAKKMTIDEFDPIFGYAINTRTNEQIPYYRNYTVKSTGAYVAPDLEIPTEGGASKPLNVSSWSTAFIGAKVLVASDPLNAGARWLYTVVGIDPDTGNIIYDDGVATEIDASQYDGTNVSISVGMFLSGGHDGDFQEITVNGETRAPSSAEMKLLLAREYVKAFHGYKDAKILSPMKVALDFIIDANYNLTNDESLKVESTTIPISNNSTVLTDKDAQVLAVTGSDDYTLSFTDLNVKKAMYDLISFRNINGMPMAHDIGAGCHLFLDCNLVGLKSMDVNYELLDIINMMSEFTGRNTSVDLGYYQIYDPVTKKKIDVTVTYFIAQKLVPHILRNGLNKPFVYSFARLTAIQKDSSLSVAGDMIRDTFRPAIDLIDWDVKEKLYESRINYWLVTNEGRVVERACQNTRQLEASCLLEENNARVLDKFKKILEEDCRGFLYQWNNPTVRKAYTTTEKQKFKNWIGTIVEDLDINFDANEFEQKRMIMHCYAEIKFFDIAKRIILEINVERPDYSGGEG